MDDPATLASVKQDPLFLTDPNGNRFHNASAIGGPVSRTFIHMKAMQTIGAMVSLTGSKTNPSDHRLAVFTSKLILAGVVSISNLFISFF